jgi:pimeloyl-ACP methyl ester carboxylesterase
VTKRFRRNGYSWDIHGTLYTPEREHHPGVAIFLIHGGAGSEDEFRATPDGRPGLGAILASHGFRVLAATYPGHYPPGGVWKTPVRTRQPIYLLDRKLSPKKTKEQNLRASLNVYVQGAAELIDANLGGRKILAHGHSAGGNMVMLLHRFLKKSVITGILGWGSGVPYAWKREWSRWIDKRIPRNLPLNAVSRRSTEFFKKSGYVDPPALTPWGGAEEFIAWGNRCRSHMRMGVLDNQAAGDIDLLKSYTKLTGLPEIEYLDHLHDPDPEWLAHTNVLMMAGENDRVHWLQDHKTEDKLDSFIGEKFRQRTPRTRLVLVPKYGHYGFLSLYNEKIAYTWMWAFKEGFFGKSARRGAAS